MTFLFVASQLWRECVRQRQIRPALTHHIRRLPSHGRSLFRSCPRLVLHSQRNIWHTASSMSPVFVQGTYTPQVHAHVGRTAEPERSNERPQNAIAGQSYQHVFVSKSIFPSAAVSPLLPAALSCTLAPARATCLWSADDHKLPFTGFSN